ncbi:chemotaxis-specific protein-glutamate methyltransferase CheB [Devosia sp. FJ2-5-3]|uniref:chemotaxis-specific protein-glutamate methyltransferase CheB n=1 Tax=Devosia sp. FJ2-5-3 TaxID=2976680 RepID=UPI0023D7FFC4|nr:chemotaxis-specific protein-glutamate methyltransferase CheB [Devosia sp. FJ2-5-3]WEJ59205.1 chemotaxis-specific protein-glutamate methyltransferase CheB [Devosia sp. FJ2-5-3]
MTKLLIVDDSALMRRQLTQLFASAGDFEILQARNGREAVEQNRLFQPDVVTLDINMPEMDGLTALSQIMVERPIPVVMVSSLTEKGALATFEALSLGAVDFIVKPGGTISLSIDEIGDVLISKVRAAARARLRKKPSGVRSLITRIAADKDATEARRSTRAAPTNGVVVIGVSTGGPRTLDDILPALPASFPWPVLIAQHMPAAFTKAFAERLNQNCRLRVVEVSSPTPVEAGTVYIARGGADMVLTQRVKKLTLVPQPENAQHLWHPSVELLGRSVLEHCDPASVIGVMLTGMGSDGAEAFAEIKQRGGRTIAESEDTAVVFGMPKELINRRGASVVLAADKIAGQLNHWAAR